MTIDEFIERRNISAVAERRESNPNMTDAAPKSTHWLVTICGPFGRAPIPFTQGAACTEPPTAADVLDCVAMDIASADGCEGAIEMHLEMGGTIESKADVHRAEQIWDAIRRNRVSLAAVLGTDAMEELEEVERL